MKLTKTKEELQLMKKSGEISACALKVVLKQVKPGVTCKQLDQTARREIETNGGSPSFMTVEDYKWTICTTINDQVVHGIPTDRQLANGDVLGIDIGAIYEGFHSDMATTVAVGQVSPDVQNFIETGKKTLKLAIDQAKAGNHIGDISETIEENIKGANYSIVKSLTGHGVGRQLHEDPMIPGFGKKGKGPIIEENMTLAIEVIYAQKSGDVKLEKDGWTVSTKDGSLGGLFEQTVAITNSGPIVLTPYL